MESHISEPRVSPSTFTGPRVWWRSLSLNDDVCCLKVSLKGAFSPYTCSLDGPCNSEACKFWEVVHSERKARESRYMADALFSFHPLSMGINRQQCALKDLSTWRPCRRRRTGPFGEKKTHALHTATCGVGGRAPDQHTMPQIPKGQDPELQTEGIKTLTEPAASWTEETIWRMSNRAKTVWHKPGDRGHPSCQGLLSAHTQPPHFMAFHCDASPRSSTVQGSSSYWSVLPLCQALC